jgi:hypothetical protein
MGNFLVPAEDAGIVSSDRLLSGAIVKADRLDRSCLLADEQPAKRLPSGGLQFPFSALLSVVTTMSASCGPRLSLDWG